MMPTSTYRILELRPESSERFEALGSKPKFWFRMQETGKPWLFKFARPNTGEDWAEKVSAELADLLETPACDNRVGYLHGQAWLCEPDVRA